MLRRELCGSARGVRADLAAIQTGQQAVPQDGRPCGHGRRLLQGHRAVREGGAELGGQQSDALVRQGVPVEGWHMSLGDQGSRAWRYWERPC